MRTVLDRATEAEQKKRLGFDAIDRKESLA